MGAQLDPLPHLRPTHTPVHVCVGLKPIPGVWRWGQPHGCEAGHGSVETCRLSERGVYRG